MRFSSERTAEEFEDLLGDLACALEARIDRHAAGERATLWFAPGALGDTELELLGRAPASEIDPPRDGMARVRCSLGRLEELARVSRGARCLAAAQRAASSAPGPHRVMGILNVTPDSFFDGGAHFETERAIEHGLDLIGQGADIVDVGGESTRPGAESVPLEVELERVLPVLAALARDGRAALSIDTRKSGVARAALDAGASIVNDVSAGRSDPELLPLVAERGAGVILMHMRGNPGDMQMEPRYDDVVREVCAHLRARARAALDAGIAPACIAIDPGIGFGKLFEHNLELLRALPELRSLGLPLVLGVSRKSFLGRLAGEEDPARRGSATLAAVTLGALLGAEIHRVHDVGPVRAALRVVAGLTADRREDVG